MKTNCIYIKCEAVHLDALIEISRDTFVAAFEKDNDPTDFKNYIEKAFSKDTMQAELLNNETDFYFVKQEDKLVGYFKVNKGKAQTDLKFDYSMELERIYVRASHQGFGVGVEILSKVKELAGQQGKTMLWLGVWEHNQRAIRFYQRNGFYKFGTHPYFIGADEQTDWIMRFDLTTLYV